MADPTNPTNNNAVAQSADDIAKANEASKIQKDIANEYATALTNIGTNAAESGKYINLLAIAATGASKSFTSFGNSTDKLTSFSTQLGVLEKAGSLTIDALKSVAASAGLGAKAFNMTADALIPYIKNIGEAADDTINFQQGYIAIAGSAGGLSKIFQDSGENLMNLNEVMRAHQQVIHNIADSTHSTADEVAKFATTMGTSLPEAFTNQINVTDSAGRSLTALEATMSLARGTGRSVADVTKDMTTAYEDFNMKGNEALEWTARMTDLSSKFNIPLSYTEGFLKDNANAFSMLSDKVGTADVTFNRMFDAFKNTGLSAKQSVALISEMENGLSKLTTTQKAFLSAQSGGPGGLRGAAHIDNLIREGKTDEVMKMAEDNLKKRFGGQIYTQKDAETSDFAASQFYKQQQMVKSGAFGSLVKDDASATRVLEAMKAGTNAKDALKDPTSVLQGTVGKGQQLQQTTNTILLDLLHAVQEGKSMGGYTVTNAIQRNIGSTIRSDRSTGGDARANLLKDAESKAIVNTADVTTRIKNNKPLDNIDKLSEANLNRAGNTIKSAVPPEMAKKFQEVIDLFKPKGDEGQISIMNDLLKAQRDVQSKQNITSQLPLNTGRGAVSAQAVQTVQAVNRRPAVSPIQDNNLVSRRPHGKDGEKSEVVVTINGVICESCHKPISPSTHSEVINQGTFHK